jgi:hypothetical protein
VTINLSKANFLSEVQLRVLMTNGATSNTQQAPNTIVDGVQRIEVLANGAQVKNYRGYECIKWAHYTRKEKAPYDRTQNGADVQFQVFPIEFGRYFGDQMAMLPAKLFRTLTLRWTNVFPISATLGFATGTARADVLEYEWVSDDPPQSKIILRETEVTQFTTVATGASRQPAGGLPLGNLITKILLHEYQHAVDDGVDISFVRLGINNFAEIPIGLSRWVNIQDNEAQRYQMRFDTYSAILYVGNTGLRDTRVGRIRSLAAIPGTALTSLTATVVAGDTVTFGQSDLATPTVVAGNQPNYVCVEGSAPVAYCVLLDLDPASDFSGGIRSNLVNSVDLEVTNGGAGGLLVVSMQEAITVPAPA